MTAVSVMHLPYAEKPGSGPEGKTCATCIHRWRQRYTKGYVYKCYLMVNHWTFNKKTDIKNSSPSCVKYSTNPADDTRQRSY